jgi:hypothetical protein
MACNCDKKNDDIPGVPTPEKPINWNMILLVLLILAIVWYFFLKSKGPDAFFNK